MKRSTKKLKKKIKSISTEKKLVKAVMMVPSEVNGEDLVKEINI